MSFRIIIGADIVPTPTNQTQFESGDMGPIVSRDLHDQLLNADFRIFNLEVPLTDKEHPIKKAGPHLIASTKCIEGIKALGIDFVTLANNHIMDQGEEGLSSTVRTLSNAGILFAGVGRNLEDAS